MRGVKQWRNVKLDWAAAIATGVALAAVGARRRGLGGRGVAHRCRAAGGAVGRLESRGRRAASRILWVLHLAYLWIPLGLALVALTQFGVLPRSAGIHALAIGATGGLIIGMITRTALGHTGRMLIAGRIETAAYALVLLAALVRVLTVGFIPAAQFGGVHAAATLWSLAFLLYLWRYSPYLWYARVDGKEG